MRERGREIERERERKGDREKERKRVCERERGRERKCLIEKNIYIEKMLEARRCPHAGANIFIPYNCAINYYHFDAKKVVSAECLI